MKVDHPDTSSSLLTKDLIHPPTSFQCFIPSQLGFMKSHAMDEEEKAGVHKRKDGSKSMSNEERGRRGTAVSHATDVGEKLGVHKRKDGSKTMSIDERGEVQWQAMQWMKEKKLVYGRGMEEPSLCQARKDSGRWRSHPWNTT
jgi:hypothetical protein